MKHTRLNQIAMFARKWLNANSGNGLANMLFYIEMWCDVPPEFHYPIFSVNDQPGSGERTTICQIQCFHVNLLAKVSIHG